MEELKDGWRNLKLKEVLSLKRGYDLPSRDRKNGKYKIIASSNENGFHNEFKVEGPGVVTGRSGTLGIVQYVNDKFWPLNTTLYVNDFKGNNKKFIYYFLQILKLENYKTGTTVPTLNRNHILDLEIKLPLLETQEKIASILSALDDKIELNNEMNKTLEEMAQTLFKRWFIDFDFPNENGEPYRSSGGKMVDSELGEIPEGWEVLSLLDIANYLNGLAMQKYRPKGHESIKVIKIREMNNGFSLDSDLCCTTIPEKYKIKNGDILFSWSGTLKLMLWNKEIGGLNQHIFKVTSEKFEKWFIYLWTKFHLNNFIHVAESRATTMGHIKRQNLKEAKVIVPRKDMILKMDKIMIPILEDIINYNEEIQSLTEIRDTLLPKLMSGEVEV